ncbi:MAG: Gfo/Idh/MocA family oxidoreductase [Stellaceae bacterium]
MATLSDNPIRLGIIGCGAVARIAHLKALATLPQYEVRYLCDRDLAVARAAKTMFGLQAETTGRIQDLAGGVDAAIVCVWPNLHKPITLELLAMGADVLCEKPIAANSVDAAAMAEAAKAAERILAIGHWCRYLKNMWVLRKLLDSSFFGEIREIVAEFGAILDWPMATGAYYDRSLTNGGVMFDAGIHVVDLVYWLFGEINDIQFEDDSYGGTETNGILRGNVRIKDRAVPCRVAASWTHPLRNSVRVVGSEAEAEARLNEPDFLTVVRSIGGERVRLLVPAGDLKLPFRSSIPQVGLLEDFAQSVRSLSSPITPAEGTLAPLRTIETAYSVRRPIAQPWVEAGLGTGCHTNAS